jgi:NADPH oxidase
MQSEGAFAAGPAGPQGPAATGAPSGLERDVAYDFSPGQGDVLLSKAGAASDFTWQEVKNYYVNDGPKAIFVALFVLINLGLFAERFLHYYMLDDDGVAVYEAIGIGIPVARGAAGAIKFCAPTLLLTVLRNFLSFPRNFPFAKYLPLDKNIVFHKGIAWTLLFWVIVHFFAHYFNYLNLSIASADPADVRDIIPAYPFNSKQEPGDFGFGTVPGITGHVLVLIMVLMYSSAIISIRRPMFEVFWYTHHLFIPFFSILCFHGFPGLLEPPTFYLWFAGPGALYALERLARVIRGNEDTVLGMAIQHPSKVLELRMKKSTFVFVPGEYLFLNCPILARYEWHPFTITSAPEEDFVSVHIRAVGDWTEALSKLFNPDNRMGVVAQDITTAADGSPILRIDGAFGAASADVFHYRTVVLIGAGIGVTPFSAILKSIRYKLEKQKMTGIQMVNITKCYFFWIARDRAAFEWFTSLLHALEQDNINNFLEIHTYLTGAMKQEDIVSIMYGEDEGVDAITGLQSSTHYGRPIWDQIFKRISSQHPDEEVGVFFCGPSVLSKALYSICRKLTFSNKNGCKLAYQKENF